MSDATLDQLEPQVAGSIVEDLRQGLPPQRFVRLYAVGNEDLFEGIKRHHFEAASSRGKIRFVSGAWGRGKTHFLRLLREQAFKASYLVSTVQLAAESTPFNKFEQVFFEVIRNIASPEMYAAGDLQRANSFGEVLKRALFGRSAESNDTVDSERLLAAREKLMADDSIDIDFRRMVAEYWDTFHAKDADEAALQDVRGKILQWFAGEGTISSYRSQFGVQKIVGRTNARFMLESLSRFARHIGFKGIVVLLDEAEMSFSTMRKSNLQQAHNNLLYLINSIEVSEGLLLVYAATPDFFTDPVHGIYRYGALAQRIGRPEERPPRALDRVWNLDAAATTEGQYLEAVRRIRQIYIRWRPEAAEALSEHDLLERTRLLIAAHPEFATVSTWRVVVEGAIEILDAAAEGRPLEQPEALHDEIMSRFRDQ